MKQFLPPLPLSQNQAARLYWELQKRGAYCTGERLPWAMENFSEEELLTLAIAQSRYDPRLLAILTDFFRNPQRLDPIRFKQCLREAEGLQTAAVIGEYVLESSPKQGVRDLFDFLRSGVPPLPTQLFYRGLYPIAGRKIDEALSKPLWAFKKWGFLAADAPLLKERAMRRSYLYDSQARLQILRELSSHGAFRLRDYLAALQYSISRQQALKDVRSVSWIQKRGCGKGSVYRGP